MHRSTAILGPSESGKTTIVKQMQIIHLNGFSDAQMSVMRTRIYDNVVFAMDQLLKGMARLELVLPPDCEVRYSFKLHMIPSYSPVVTEHRLLEGRGGARRTRGYPQGTDPENTGSRSVWGGALHGTTLPNLSDASITQARWVICPVRWHASSPLAAGAEESSQPQRPDIDC